MKKPSKNYELFNVLINNSTTINKMKQCNSFAFNVENYLVLGTNNKDPFK